MDELQRDITNLHNLIIDCLENYEVIELPKYKDEINSLLNYIDKNIDKQKEDDVIPKAGITFCDVKNEFEIYKNIVQFLEDCIIPKRLYDAYTDGRQLETSLFAINNYSSAQETNFNRIGATFLEIYNTLMRGLASLPAPELLKSREQIFKLEKEYFNAPEIKAIGDYDKFANSKITPYNARHAVEIYTEIFSVIDKLRDTGADSKT